MLVAWAVGYLVLRKAPEWGLVDLPGERKVHTRVTPLGGGLAIWAGTVLPLAAGQMVLWLVTTAREPGSSLGWAVFPLPEFVELHLAGLRQEAPRLWLLLGAGTVLMLLGLADDRRGLDWRLRLSVEFAVAAVMVACGWKLTFFVEQPIITSVISVFWIVALINSFNMLDNMDALSGGVAAIVSGLLAVVMLFGPAHATGQPQLFVGGLLLVLFGSLLGFLWHNRPPARLFMGDAGAYFIGFMVAMATMMATFVGTDTPRHAILAPLCVLAVPLYDLVTVVTIRLRNGLSPFAADKRHFSHRLVELGMSKTQAVLTIYLTTAATGLGALLLYQVNTLGAVVVLLMVACSLMVVAILETTGRRSQRRK
ncbi:MAG: undecaprenyl/decaprenyl-phosphate alpha-N-acetylglucosaminyl 1-phosphate transferase [Pirellulales bacterium]|nr:undecaprenyl/decaprenyl-phosphate alpha-N-acetylglucosaminyl 1-phosphate transferase [Pirellulales bacterium]